MSLSPALVLYTLYCTRVYNTCLFFLRLLFFGRRSFYRKHLFHIASVVYDDGALFFSPFIYFIHFFGPFVYRCYCRGVRCVLKNHNRITIHHSLKSVRFLRLSVRKRKKINTKQNT